MAAVRTFVTGDTSRIWELLNEIRAAVNPVVQDTGRRSVGDSLSNGGTAHWSGSAHLRRVGDIVYCTGFFSIPTGSTFIAKSRDQTQFLSIPDGFKPIFSNYAMVLGRAGVSGGTSDCVWNSQYSRLAVSGSSGTWAAGNSLSWVLSWMTDQPFPSSLPGTAL